MRADNNSKPETSGENRGTETLRRPMYPAVPPQRIRAWARGQASGRPVNIKAAAHQSASDFLQRNYQLRAKGLRTHDLGLDYLKEGSAGVTVPASWHLERESCLHRALTICRYDSMSWGSIGSFH